MNHPIEEGGDCVSSDLRFQQGLLRACHNRMAGQMGKALGALLRTSFEMATARPDGPAQCLPLHRAVLQVLATRRRLPSLGTPPPRLVGRVKESTPP